MVIVVGGLVCVGSNGGGDGEVVGDGVGGVDVDGVGGGHGGVGTVVFVSIPQQNAFFVRCVIARRFLERLTANGRVVFWFVELHSPS